MIYLVKAGFVLLLVNFTCRAFFGKGWKKAVNNSYYHLEALVVVWLFMYLF